MKLIFLYFQFINNVFFLVPPAVLVIMENQSYYQDFLIFFKYIYTPFKMVIYWEVCKSQSECAYHFKKYFPLFSFKLIKF